MVSKKYWCTEVSDTYCGTSMTLWSSIRNLAYSYLALERGEARDMAKRCLSGQAVTIVIWWVIEQTSSSRVFFVLWDFFFWILCFLVKFFYCICEITVGVPDASSLMQEECLLLIDHLGPLHMRQGIHRRLLGEESWG
jgi:hypothetical protein